jgi:hypothetical protein
MATIGMANSRDTDRKIGACGYVSTPAATTVTTAGTYYPIAGTFTNPCMEQFQAVADPAIQYIGDQTLDFEIDWHAAVSCDNSTRHVTMGIKKNADVVASSLMGTTLKTAGDEYSLSGTCVVSLAKNDKIQLILTSDNDGDEVTANHYTTTIRPFYF